MNKTFKKLESVQMGINYIRGNLLDAPQVLIVHQCNAQDTMGSGVALAIKNKYRQAYEDYRNDLEMMPKSKRLGKVVISYINDKRSVANLVGQYHYLPRGELHTDYGALTTGFEKIKSLTNCDIAMPKIGCGLGGGDWKVVSKIIEEIFNDRDVYIYEL
jgi:O-acetyl-ADP-ribose deacetylase (regulator of RNase III)